jgi:hypothetical protein
MILIRNVRAASLLVERPGCEADRSSPSNADVKAEWSYVSAPTMLSCHEREVSFMGSRDVRTDLLELQEDGHFGDSCIEMRVLRCTLRYELDSACLGLDSVTCMETRQ